MGPLQAGRLVAVHTAKNLAMGVPMIRKRRVAAGRTAGLPTPAQIAHKVDKLIDRVAETTGPVAGKSVLEIGPGDNLATGLVFLSQGARSYTALDRFAGDYSGPRAQMWYAAVRKARGLPEGVFPDDRVTALACSVEAAKSVGQYDLICSHAVGEHVSDVSALARLTYESLSPGGVAVHIVDFSGHAIEDDADPLFFRRFPRPVWSAMGSNRGFPNRVPFSRFLSKLRHAGLSVEARNVVRFDGLAEVQEATFVCRRDV